MTEENKLSKDEIEEINQELSKIPGLVEEGNKAIGYLPSIDEIGEMNKRLDKTIAKLTIINELKKDK